MTNVFLHPDGNGEAAAASRIVFSDLLRRRQTHFMLWRPSESTQPPVLMIGHLEDGNPPAFYEHKRLPLHTVPGLPGLWELAAAHCNLIDGKTYHYWFEVEDTSPWSSGQRIFVTDPLASGVDYRLTPPTSPNSRVHPASVITWSGRQLVPKDLYGERIQPELTPFDRLPANNQIVIYELPTAWTRSFGFDEFERAVGTFRDILTLVEEKAAGANFPELCVTQQKVPYLCELGVNALQMLPVQDSVYAREWGYGTSHYLAPDYELGFPEGHLSPTPNQDLTLLVNACHRAGIRVILDVVLGFMKDDPYRHIDFNNYYLEDPSKHRHDPNAWSSRDDGRGGKELRNSYGASTPRYIASKTTYDPMSGEVKDISPVRQYMLTFLTRWMQDFHVDGFRLDSVETVANWDFISAFREAGYEQFKARYPEQGERAREKFVVVGEELAMPRGLLDQKRLDGLWNEHFQSMIRAAVLGESAGSLEPNFEWTVRRAIDCRIDHLNGSQVINYLTTHDVEGTRKERMYNMLMGAITLENSAFLFNRQELENEVRAEDPNVSWDDLQNRVNGRILHRARLRRIKLAFVGLLTAVGMPMILAGEEFGDQHDLFDNQGNVTHKGGKQVDPVNFSRKDEKDRGDLFRYVARLVKLRTSHEGLAVDDTDFIHVDFSEGKRVLAWKRGTTNPVVVVANFSAYQTPGGLSNPNAEYVVHNWPATPEGKSWCEVTQNDRPVPEGKAGREPIFGWEAKVYRLV